MFRFISIWTVNGVLQAILYYARAYTISPRVSYCIPLISVVIPFVRF